jgi:hypothetical protein
MKAHNIVDKLKHFMDDKINILSKSNPLINFTQPFIMRIIDGKSSKLIEILDMFADEKGNIDINGLVDDIINRLNHTDPFIMDLMSITKLEIGGGKIRLGIPLTDKVLVFNTQDLLSLKEDVVETVKQGTLF